MYRIQLLVLRQNAVETFCDKRGCIVFIVSNKLVSMSPLSMVAKKGKGPVCPGLEDVRDMRSGTVRKTFMDDTLPSGPVERTIEYVAPFGKKDREEDYRVAWGRGEI